MKRMSFAAAVLTLAACGGSNQPKATPGATLEGTVQGPTNLTVDVPGTSLSTRTDASGHFAMLDVPEGSHSVHFRGGSVDASLEIEGLGKHEHRNISVTVSGHDAVEHHERSESVLHGSIEAIAAPSLTVSGKTVVTTSATAFSKNGAAIAFADLSVGDSIEAEGAMQADGSLLARSIKVEDAAAAGDDGAEAEDREFDGTLDAIDGAKLTVGTTLVIAGASTRIEKNDAQVALSALAVGDSLRVEGALQTDGSVLASEIKVLSAAEAAEEAAAGAVTAISAADNTFTIGTTLIRVDGHTSFSGSGSFSSLANLNVGDLVDVEGALQPDGSVLASNVHRMELPEMNEIEVKGAIEALGSASVQVQGKSFAIDSSTEFRGGLSFASLKTGMQVEVRGMKRADGSLVATRVSPQN